MMRPIVEYAFLDGSMKIEFRGQDHGETFWPTITFQIGGKVLTGWRTSRAVCQCRDCRAANP